MILVDTSVLIKFFKGDTDHKTEIFKEILGQDVPFGISAYTYQEILQGARDEEEYQTLREYLSTQTIYFLVQEPSTFEKAARIYFNLRRNGVTPRSTLDILIALTAIANNLVLLHHDHDFDIMAGHIKELRYWSKLGVVEKPISRKGLVRVLPELLQRQSCTGIITNHIARKMREWLKAERNVKNQDLTPEFYLRPGYAKIQDKEEVTA